MPLIARGQDDDGHHHAGGAPPPQDIEPGQSRQTEIEDGEIVMLGGSEELAPLAVPRAIDRVPGALEVPFQRRAQQRVIFDQEQAHDIFIVRLVGRFRPC
jgi:hypothetical protein